MRFLNFSESVAWQTLDDMHLPWALVNRQLAGNMCDHLVWVHCRTRSRHDHGFDSLAEVIVGHAHNCYLCHSSEFCDGGFNLTSANFVTARFDDVDRRSANDSMHSISTNDRRVAGHKPPIGRG